jgi:hypothetical protein
MASQKNKPFKQEIGNQIFLHKILGFKDGKLIEFNHTFADYKLKQNQDFFLRIISSFS